MTKNELAEWPHYQRKVLAKLHLEQVKLGIRTFSMFAPRGFGKTEFIKKDLLPAATKAGFRCIYVDLWLIAADPVESLIQQLRPDSVTATQGRSRFPRLQRAVRRITAPGGAEAKITASTLGQSIEFGMQRSVQTAANRSEALLQAFTACLSEDNRTILLVMDEVQSLASPKHEGIVKTLRSIFQAHDARIVRIFTGSSRSGLDRMFRRQKAALFQQGGADITLPPLDQGFVQMIADWCARQTGGRLVIDVGDGTQVLRNLAYSARLFRKAVEQVLVGRAVNLQEAGANVQHTELVDPLLAAKLESLNDLQRVLLHAIWNSGVDIYSADARAQYASALRIESVSVTQVQGSIRRLERLELIYRSSSGEYSIEPPELDLLIERNSLRIAGEA